MEKQKHILYIFPSLLQISSPPSPWLWPFNSNLGTSCVRGIPDLPFLSEWNHDLLGPGGVTSLSFPTWLAGTVIASEILEFSTKKTSRTNSSQSVFFFQANCHCHRMASLSSQIKLNTQLDTICLSLNQFFAAKALHAGWRLCNGVHTMRPWYHGSFTLKESLYLCSFCITPPKLNHAATTGIQQNGSINGWFFKFRIASSNVAPHGFIFLRPWPRESGFHFTHALVGFWLVWIGWQAAHTRQLQGLNGFP